MKSASQGYTLIEVLIAVAMIAVLVGVAAAYRMNNVNLQLAELDFQERYNIAKNILLHAQNLHTQGFRYSGALDIEQLKVAARGGDRQASVNRISKITADYAKDDFKMYFNAQDIRVRFLVADDVVLKGYPLQRHRIAGDKDEVVLTKTMQVERSRVLRLNNYLAN
ncbi:MAG: prepilin-type N-terminal cleavage/methylation domain-containing protein [Gammaproteobacteria bacterium]|nr:prepilin-type N-terminal cleavage/methylation domain-containing protein [Gammaproteobacteria bacterium]